MSGLRKVVGASTIETRSPGYRIDPDALSTDLSAFHRRVVEGQAALAQREYARAVAIFDDALALWEGEPFGEFRDEEFARVEVTRVDEARLAAHEGRADALLRMGHDPNLVGELIQLLAAHPHRERLVELLALALYREGRQSEALEVLRAASERLLEDLGIDPSPALRQVQDDILNQAVTLPAATWAVGENAPPIVGVTFGRDDKLSSGGRCVLLRRRARRHPHRARRRRKNQAVPRSASASSASLR